MKGRRSLEAELIEAIGWQVADSTQRQPADRDTDDLSPAQHVQLRNVDHAFSDPTNKWSGWFRWGWPA